MIKVKNYYYFISERLVKDVFKRDNRFYVRLESDIVYEIEEQDYYNLGGK